MPHIERINHLRRPQRLARAAASDVARYLRSLGALRRCITLVAQVHAMNHRPWGLPVLAGGVAAAIASTVVQVALWLAFTNAFPHVLCRDARMAAAIVLGRDALAADVGCAPGVLAASTVVHFVLSFAYAALFCTLTRGLRPAPAHAAGAALGAALFFLNMYGFTLLFPWFAVARDWITFAAHVAFGVSAVWGCRRARRRLQRGIRD